MMLWTLINAITFPMINLYEQISYIVDNGKGSSVKLSFKLRNHELNVLNLNFNKAAKTMMLANVKLETRRD
jgi:tetratricopeptide (TPR) repeat protein